MAEADKFVLEGSINRLCSQIGTINIEKGFRQDIALINALTDNLEVCEYLMNNIIATKLMLIVSEASEALDSLRKVGSNKTILGEGNFIEELADIMIRVMDLADIVGLDLGAAVVDKIEINSSRPHKHGKKF